MALIKCKECGKEISDKATTCIHCGNPLNKEIKQTTNRQSDNKNVNNTWKIIAISVLVLIVIIIGILSIIPHKNAHLSDQQRKQDFQKETYYCRKSVNSYLHNAELNAVDYISVNVRIVENHNDISTFSQNAQDFINKVCDMSKYLFKENQTDYQYNCGNTKDTITYTYIGSMKEALKQLEDDGFSCYNDKKEGSLINILKDKKWCNYLMYRYYYTFDDMANKNYSSSYITSTKYSISGNTITIHEDSYDYQYTYDANTNTITPVTSGKTYGDNHLFECENGEENYYLVSDKYYYDGKLNNSIPQAGYYNDGDYKVTNIKCTNGVKATFDEKRRMLFPSENKKSECIVYFEKVKK